MADERIDIRIGDKIDSDVEKKIKALGDAAKKADDKVEMLKKELASLRSTSVSRLAQETKKAERATVALTKSQQRLARSSASASTSMLRLAGRTAAFFGIVSSARAVFDFADSYTNLQNKVRITTDSQEQLNAVTEKLFGVARRARVEVESVATAYQRFDLALKRSGASQQESLDIAETFSKALSLGGASAQEASGSLRQLSQAFNSGRLNGQEFVSVAEQAPIVLDAIAKEMNVSRGELKELGAQGKITTEVLRNAFARLKADVDKQFGDTIPTLSQSFIVLRNSAVKAFGEINKNLGATQALAKAVLFLADNMKLLITASVAFVSVLTVALIPALKTLFALMFANPIGLVVAAIATAVTAFVLFKDEIKLTSDGLITLGDVARGTFAFLIELITPVAKYLRDAFFGAFEYIKDLLADFGTDYKGVFESVLEVNKFIANAQIRLSLGTFNAVMAIWENFGEMFSNIWRKAFNGTVGIIETHLNFYIRSINKVLDAARKVGAFFGEGDAIGSIPLLDASGFEKKMVGAGKSFGGAVADAFTEVANRDFVGEFTSALGLKIQEASAARRAAEASAPGLPNAPVGTGTVLRQAGAGSTTPAQSRSQQLSDLFGGGGGGGVGQFLGGSPEEYAQKRKEMEEYYKEIDKLRQEDVISAQTAASAKFRIWQEGQKATLDTASTFFSSMEGLQSSSSKRLQRVGKAAAIASALIDTYKSATGAYSAMSSIPYVGPALGAAAAAAAIVAGMKNVQAIRSQPTGYKSGGYTGNMGTSEVAGVVHGQEFVMNAKATSTNRAALEAMNRGQSVNTGSAVNVTVENYGSSEISVEQITQNDVRIIARDIAKSVVRTETPTVVAADISNPNGRVSKSLNQNTTTSRKR